MFKLPWFKKKESIKIDKLHILKIQEGDVIILQHPSCLNDERYNRLKEEFSKIIKSNKVIILEDRMKVETILRKENSHPGDDNGFW